MVLVADDAESMRVVLDEALYDCCDLPGLCDEALGEI